MKTTIILCISLMTSQVHANLLDGLEHHHGHHGEHGEHGHHGEHGDHHGEHGDHHGEHGDHHGEHGDHHGEHGDHQGEHGDHLEEHGDHHGEHAHSDVNSHGQTTPVVNKDDFANALATELGGGFLNNLPAAPADSTPAAATVAPAAAPPSEIFVAPAQVPAQTPKAPIFAQTPKAPIFTQTPRAPLLAQTPSSILAQTLRSSIPVQTQRPPVPSQTIRNQISEETPAEIFIAPAATPDPFEAFATPTTSPAFIDDFGATVDEELLGEFSPRENAVQKEENDEFFTSGEPKQLVGAELQDVSGRSGSGDFPEYAAVPRTSFSCADQTTGGYFADLEAQCQVFHICLNGLNLGSFLCPNGTLFHQEYFVCDWWFNVDCNAAPNSYGLNARIGVVPDDFE